MPYYQLSAPLTLLPAPPAAWDRVLAVLTPDEAAAEAIPDALKPPAHLGPAGSAALLPGGI